MERPATKAGAYVALVFVQLFFATMAVAGKLALRDLHPLVLTALRVSAAALLLLLAARLLLGPLRLTRAEARRYAVLGFFGLSLNQVLFIVGLQWVTAVDAVVLIATIPAFTYLFAVLRGEQRADAGHVAGLALAFAGVAVVVGAGSLHGRELLGAGFIVMNSASYAWYLVLSRPEVARRPPLLVVSTAFAAAALLVLAVASPWLAAQAWSEVPARAWGVVAFIVAFPTVGSYLLNLVALRGLPSRTVGAFIYLQPVFGAALAVVVLDEAIGAGTVAGAAMVLGGIAMVMRERAA